MLLYQGVNLTTSGRGERCGFEDEDDDEDEYDSSPLRTVFGDPGADGVEGLRNHSRFLEAEIAAPARQRQTDDYMVEQGNLQNPGRLH